MAGDMQIRGNRGFTLIEALMVMGIFSVIMGATYFVLFSGKSVWATLDVQIQLQENLRNTIGRVSKELKETGADGNGVMQLSISDGTGVNNSDVIRFSIPVCVCSNIVIDANGNVAHWGAPLAWGKLSCITDVNTIIADSEGKADICHLPPGNPENTQDLSVALSAVSAHLAHGDWVGTCAPCTTDNNKFIEYRLNAANQLVRRILNSNTVLVREDVFALGIADFQASLNGAQDVVTFVVTASRNTIFNRPMSRTISMDVFLRNKG